MIIKKWWKKWEVEWHKDDTITLMPIHEKHTCGCIDIFFLKWHIHKNCPKGYKFVQVE